MRASGGARKQKISDIGACDQEDKTGQSREDQPLIGKFVASVERTVTKWMYHDALINRRFSISKNGPEQYIYFRLDLRRGHARFSPSEDMQPHKLVRCVAYVFTETIDAGHYERLHEHGQPQVGVLAHGFSSKILCGDANDDESVTVEAHGRSDDALLLPNLRCQ